MHFNPHRNYLHSSNKRWLEIFRIVQNDLYVYECCRSLEREINDCNRVLFFKLVLPFQLPKFHSGISKDEEMNQTNKYLHLRMFKFDIIWRKKVNESSGIYHKQPYLQTEFS